ncbi:hypothetical protein [Paenibacillus sp.]|uniref:hypothetical protein n=1 Tax=Paenibacillus sp. TaxID=58172 RepID=UPI002D62C8FB|nr:hypothetical protein [Paenibacillus sp.]HZG84992.1 hypothetical protein [Paenibacillus sp.]
MSLSRTVVKRQIRDRRRRWLKRAFWLLATATLAGTLGSWLWDWTGTPVYLE